MTATVSAPPDELSALDRGRAFADLSAYRKVQVSGTDARAWLHSLVTTDVDSLAPGRSRRSLMLTPTGRICADFSVACDEAGFLLLQAPSQPDHVGLLLAPYTLSSDVVLRDATNELALFAVPGDSASKVGRPGLSRSLAHSVLAPSVLGAGVDLVAPVGQQAWRVEDMFVKKNLVEVGPAAMEGWRVLHGSPRMGADFDQSSLPAEAGLQDAIDFTKGCFLGQESVAKVAKLGHPPTVLRSVRADSELKAGMQVMSRGAPVGEVTSATLVPPSDGLPRAKSWAGIVRVTWEAAEEGLTTGSGVPFRHEKPVN
jgi:tRNA-modifying protein YgfZ